MPLDRIYRDISFGDSQNLDSFSRTRVSDVSQKVYIDFKYGIDNNPSVKVRASSFGAFRPTLTYNSTNKSAVFGKSLLTTGTNDVTLTSVVPTNVKAGSTFKGYISFRLLDPSVLSGVTEAISIGFGSDVLQTGDMSFKVNTSSGIVSYSFSIFQTTFAGGSATTISRNFWTDPLDGSGPSGLTIDFTKVQILFIKTETGKLKKITYGFVIDGKEVEALSQNFEFAPGATPNGNFTSNFAPYASLNQTNVTTATDVFEVYSMTSCIEDDGEKTSPLQYDFSTSLSTGSLSAGAYSRVLCVRATSPTAILFSHIILKNLKIINTGNVPLYWQLRVRESIPSGSYSTINSNSNMQINTTVINDVTSPTETASDKIVALAGFVNSNEITITEIPESISTKYPIDEIASPAPAVERGTSLWITPVSTTTVVSARVVLNYKEIRA
jgi:hypothetical protein